MEKEEEKQEVVEDDLFTSARDCNRCSERARASRPPRIRVLRISRHAALTPGREYYVTATSDTRGGHHRGIAVIAAGPISPTDRRARIAIRSPPLVRRAGNSALLITLPLA